MMKIVILEDNEGRRSAMRDCLHDRFQQYESIFFADAKKMCAYLEANLQSVLIISLDHDLELEPRDNGKPLDPGTGRGVAEFLALRPPCCPIIIATTNSAAGDGMEFLLREANWDIHRVHPHGDMEWVPSVWFRTVRNAIVGLARPRAETRK
jgi:hypothetical protein